MSDNTPEVHYEPFELAVVENKLPDCVENESGVDNGDRARMAFTGIAAYAAASGLYDDLKTDPDTVLSDFLADLRHWADTRKLDWVANLSSSQIHYVAEATGQEP